MSDVSREEFDGLTARVEGLDRSLNELVRTLTERVRFVVEAAAERQIQHEEFMKRVAEHLNIEDQPEI